MKFPILVPYGLVSQEAGLAGLVANYLRRSSPEVSLLQCNGLFSLCDREAENNWRRTIQSCFACMTEQNALATWCGIPSVEISKYLRPEDVIKTQRWVTSLSKADLFDAEFDGIRIYDLCRGSIRNRFGTERPDIDNRNTEQVVRRMLNGSARMYRTSRGYLVENKTQISLVVSGADFISRSYIEALEQTKNAFGLFCWNLSSKAIDIFDSNSGRTLSCPLVFDDITAMRPDVRTWPTELLRILDEILVFVGIVNNQMELPLAQ